MSNPIAEKVQSVISHAINEMMKGGGVKGLVGDFYVDANLYAVVGPQGRERYMYLTIHGVNDGDGSHRVLIRENSPVIKESGYDTAAYTKRFDALRDAYLSVDDQDGVN